jgi:hypothetical protein
MDPPRVMGGGTAYTQSIAETYGRRYRVVSVPDRGGGELDRVVSGRDRARGEMDRVGAIGE